MDKIVRSPDRYEIIDTFFLQNVTSFHNVNETYR